MNRTERLHRELAGTGCEDVIPELASLSAGQVDSIVTALRRARRAGRLDEQESRRKRRQFRRRGTDDSDFAGAADRMTLSAGQRAGSDLDTLTRLADHYRDGRAVLGWAVQRLRDQGVEDVGIAAAMGVSPATINRRYGARGDQEAPVHPELKEDARYRSASRSLFGSENGELTRASS